MQTVNPWKSYRQINTLTASRGKLVLMLFEGALLSLERSLPGFSIADPAEGIMTIHNNLKKAQQIIRALNGALNMEEGGEFASTLRQLYSYFIRRLQESNVRKQSDGVEEVIRHLTVLRDAWATMLETEETISSP
jgi:flagellar protein FliS